MGVEKNSDREMEMFAAAVIGGLLGGGAECRHKEAHGIDDFVELHSTGVGIGVCTGIVAALIWGVLRRKRS